MFTVYNTINIMHNISKGKYFDIVRLKVKKILAVLFFFNFWSNWLRLIHCAKISHFSRVLVLNVQSY